MGKKQKQPSVYTVEDILDVREQKVKKFGKMSMSKRQYLVKWLGYPKSQCTWEPQQSFTSQAALNHFLNCKNERQKKEAEQKGAQLSAQKDEQQLPAKEKPENEQKVKIQDPPGKKETEEGKSQKAQLAVKSKKGKIQIVEVKRKAQAELEFTVKIDGKKAKLDQKTMHKQFHQELLCFYESHLTFE